MQLGVVARGPIQLTSAAGTITNRSRVRTAKHSMRRAPPSRAGERGHIEGAQRVALVGGHEDDLGQVLGPEAVPGSALDVSYAHHDVRFVDFTVVTPDSQLRDVSGKSSSWCRASW